MREIAINIAVLCVTLGACEAILRIIDLRELRDGYGAGFSTVFRYDQELGWRPIPNSKTKFRGSREITIEHNSLGLRDIEHDNVRRPNILFLGDSFVWGYDVQASDRFTERLRENLPSVSVINAGVPGYGTDQEYLLLRRIWNSTKPDVVVLIFCTNNDRDDNSTNMRYGRYLKPYLERNADGTKRFAGMPVPWSYHVYFNENRLVHNLWLARAAVTIYSYFFQAKLIVADPTEDLIGMTRSLVESRGAKFLVGLQDHDPKLEAFLQAQGIPFVTFDGAEVYPVDGNHWTPNGHALVADRLMSLFRAVDIPGPL